MTSRRQLAPGVAPALATILLTVAACGSPADEPAGPPPPIVVISIDTLRSDRLPAYGYADGETPAIDALAADGTLYEHAFAHAPTTLPSHASILTGVLPTEHGARDNGGFTVDPEVTTLAARLSEAGYRTGAFVSAFPIRAETGIDAGFERYDDEFDADPGAGLGEIQRAGAETLDRALAWLDEGEPDAGPPFLFFHLFEPHRPYEPPPPFAGRFTDPYDGEIAESDRVVGELIEGLRERQLYDPALIVLLSDHGESLGEHGEVGHGIFVYRAIVQVPMIVKWPGGQRAGERVATPAQTIDVAPTALSAAGLSIGQLPGLSLDDLADAPETRSIYAESYAPQLHFGWSPLTSLIEFPLQYIEAPTPELYDLEADPDQLDNRIEARPDDARRMAARLFSMLEPVTEAPEVDAQTREQLAALGYLGAGGGDAADRPDPKDKIHLLDRLREAAEHHFAGEYEQSVAIYEELLREEPNLDTDSWRFLALGQMALGRLEEAAVSFEALIALGEGDAPVYLRLAELYLALGRADEAAAAAMEIRDERPARSAIVLARVAAGRGELERARDLLREAVGTDETQAPAHALLAEILMATRGDPAEALQHVDRAIALAGEQPQGRGLRVIRGRVLLALDRPSEASSAFIEEIRRHPDNLQAYQQLAALHLSSGNDQVGMQVLEDMVGRNPGPQAELVAIDTLRQLGRTGAAEQWRARAASRYPDAPAFRSGDRP